MSHRPLLRRVALLALLAGLFLEAPTTAQPWGQWILGPGATGDWRWRAPVATTAALPADPDGSVRLVLDTGELHCRTTGAWQLCAGGGGGGAPAAHAATHAAAGSDPVTLTEAQISDLAHTVDTTCLDAGVTCNFAGSASEGGPATTALALAADGADCPAGQYARGVDTAGAAQGCTATPPGGSRTRVVTVDQGGLGDYTTVKAAVDYVASQSPGVSTPWVVEVGPGLYQEASFTVPANVHVQGRGRIASTDVHYGSETVVYNLATSGVLVTLNGGTMSDLTVALTGAPSGALTAVRATAILSGLYNVTINIGSSSATHAVVGYESTGSSTTLVQVVFNQATSAAGNTKHLRLTGAGNVSVRQSWFMDNGFNVFRAVSHEGSGHAVITYTRFGTYTGSTYATDIANVSSGTVYLLESWPRTVAGTVQLQAPRRTTATGEVSASTAGDVPVTVRGAASQTADLSRWLNSAGTRLSGVTASGSWDGPMLYTPAVGGDWIDPDPTSVKSALDALASRLTAGYSIESTATCADSGDANPGALAITPTTYSVRITSADPHGCTLTLSEAGAVDGTGVELELASSAGGTVTLADTPGAHNLAGAWSPGVGDSITLRYNATASEWRERARADI